MPSIYDFSARALDGASAPLGVYSGKTLLIANVASKCGFTPQYAGLEVLYRKFAPKGIENAISALL
jgi:glutathione peroxidase